jgi:predicted nucleotidyltransferase component of viral defense system
VIDPQLREGSSIARLLARMNREAKKAGVPARRIHLVVAIDRLLARLLVSAQADSWVVKGGFANQLRRPDDARFTQDIDLRIASTIDTAPMLVAEAFGTDLLESHLSDPVLAAIGYPRSSFPVYPVAQSIAEKIHALTLPRDRENSRARDLVDLVWFAERFSAISSELIDAAVATFAIRADHPWPPSLSTPPAAWVKPYARLRTEVGLAPRTPDDAIVAVATFLAPVFAGIRGLRWDPTAVAWSKTE